ncbi:hypothetical protein GS876_21030 [Rhodococcus hoagii]|nr:hypothetical protein [Prescottella equi]NKU31571.1 hypothetical protein [Prescottella equi]NKU51532.1 hypothetical protein [Prescottella equi]NKV19391.1 hypothetical protein [Prescottella equi]NKV67925.1 hypothetical protein [Prescottella equi]
MMGYSRTLPTVYAVEWEHDRIIKIGYSINQRWRNFVARGARVVTLMEFDDKVDALVFEQRAKAGLDAFCRPAFASADQAISRLGIGGGGWRECYRLPGDLTTREVLDQCNNEMEASNAR